MHTSIMNLTKFADEVHQWASQFTEPYFTPHQIFARLVEEFGELETVLANITGLPPELRAAQAEDELGDIYFTLMCLRNREQLPFPGALKLLPPPAHSHALRVLGTLARTINAHFGPKAFKKGEQNYTLTNAFYPVLALAHAYVTELSIDEEHCFTRAINKAYGRDNERYTRREKKNNANSSLIS